MHGAGLALAFLACSRPACPKTHPVVDTDRWVQFHICAPSWRQPANLHRLARPGLASGSGLH